MSSQNKSFNKASFTKKTSQPSNSHPFSAIKNSPSIQNRPSLNNIKGPCLSSVIGIDHLNVKRNSAALVLFKNSHQSPLSKRDSKLTVDFSNTSALKSKQPHSPGLPSQRSEASKSLIQPKSDRNHQKTNSVGKQQLGVQAQYPFQQARQIDLRNAIKTEQRKKRDNSSTKNVLVHKFVLNSSSSSHQLPMNFSIKGNINQKQQQQQPSSWYQMKYHNNGNAHSLSTNNNNSKSSVIISQKFGQSPQTGRRKSQKLNAINSQYFRSPQHPSKSSKINQFDPNQNSYSPISTSQSQVTLTKTKSFSKDINIDSTEIGRPSIINDSQPFKVLDTKGQKSIKIESTATCLQIDLSGVSSLKNNEDEHIFGIKKKESSQQLNQQQQQQPPKPHISTSRLEYANAKKSPGVISYSPILASKQGKINCKSPMMATSNKLEAFTIVSRESIASQEKQNNCIMQSNVQKKRILLDNAKKRRSEEQVEKSSSMLKQELSSPLSKKLPMTKKKFLQLYTNKLNKQEKEELNKQDTQIVYYVGKIMERSRSEVSVLKIKSEEAIQKEQDDEEGYYKVNIGDHLMYRFEILKILGKGSFAQVVQCLDHKTSQMVAIKITRNTELDHKFAKSESQSYAIQILEALVFLEDHNIIHCDLKPENILLVDKDCQRLKVVDYGSGCFVDDQVYTYVQSRFYRAPEIILRLQYTEKVDIWSFGCILAELFTGEPLFPGNNEQEQIEMIMEVCGIPPQSIIEESRKKEHYFDTDYSPFLIEDEDEGILRLPNSKTIEDAVPCKDKLFIDFIKECLELDPTKRISARQAMQHAWIQDGMMTYSKVEHASSAGVMNRKGEDDQDGAQTKVLEQSPQRPVIMKQKQQATLTKVISLTQIQEEAWQKSNQKNQSRKNLQQENIDDDEDDEINEKLNQDGPFQMQMDRIESQKYLKANNNGGVKSATATNINNNAHQQSSMRKESDKKLKEKQQSVKTITITVYKRNNSKALK